MNKFRILIIITCFFTSCTNHESKEVYTNELPTATPTILPVPEYLSDIFPEPASTIKMEDFSSESSRMVVSQPSVCVVIEITSILEKGDRYQTIQEWLPQIEVRINGEEKSGTFGFIADSLQREHIDPETGDFLFTIPSGYPFRLCYTSEWEVGLQNVELRIQKTSGELLEYEWWFSVEE